MEIDTCQIFILFQNLAELSLKNYSSFLIARIRDPIEKYSFFFTKMGTSIRFGRCGVPRQDVIKYNSSPFY